MGQPKQRRERVRRAYCLSLFIATLGLFGTVLNGLPNHIGKHAADIRP
jgi:hypothetical protein